MAVEGSEPVARRSAGARAVTAARPWIALLVRFCAAYLIGVSAAAVLTSLTGGSALLLAGISLAAGAPFFLAACVIGLIFRASVVARPLLWAVAAPVATGLLWLGLAPAMGDLLNPTRVALYAIFCAASCGAVFYVSTWLRPPR